MQRAGRVLLGLLLAGALAPGAFSQVGYYAPHIELQPSDVTIAAGATAHFVIRVNAIPSAFLQWRKNGQIIAGATSSTFDIPGAQPSDSGTYDCLTWNVQNFSDLPPPFVIPSNALHSDPATLIVADVPVVLDQPVDVTEPVGANVGFSVSAVGVPPLSYQWEKDGVALPGQTGAILPVTVNSAGDAGVYACTISNSLGTTRTAAAHLTIGPTCSLTNLSARSQIFNSGTSPLQPRDNVVIVGFSTNSARASGRSKTLLFRAVGPSLGLFGLKGDPALAMEVFSGATSMGVTSGWANALSFDFSRVGAFPLPPGSNDAATAKTLAGGTVVVSEAAANTQSGGSALAEIYDLDGSLLPRLTNLSARGYAGEGRGDLIAGFTVSGSGTKKLLIRGVGPGLAALGITTYLIPVVTVYDSSGGLVTAVQGWDSALVPIFKSVGAFPLVVGSNDAAAVVTVAAGGGYTARLSAAMSQPGYRNEGIALLEVYELP